MKIARIQDQKGQITYAAVHKFSRENAELEAKRIEGDLWNELKQTGEKVTGKLLAPVDPPNIIAIGLNYRDHAQESGMAIPEIPLVFLKATTALIGPEDPIVLPQAAPHEVDYEAELAVVIKKRARNVDAKNVEQYILGYTCANDVSARDCQLKIDKQWARGKSFDTFCPLGPWIVTADELDPSDLLIRTVLNGTVVQNSRTSRMVFSVAELVSFLSHQFTLLPGTVILTGTPPGVGFSRQLPRYLQPGDEVIVEIEGVGNLRNPVLPQTSD